MSSNRSANKNWIRGLALTRARREELSASLRLHDHFFALYEQRIRELPVAIGMIERLEMPNREDIEIKNFLD